MIFFKWFVLIIFVGQMSCSLLPQRKLASSDVVPSESLSCHGKLEVPSYNLHCVETLAKEFNFSALVLTDSLKSKTEDGFIVLQLCMEDEQHARRLYIAALNCNSYNIKEQSKYELPGFLVDNIDGPLRGEVPSLDCPAGFTSNGVNCRPVKE